MTSQTGAAPLLWRLQFRFFGGSPEFPDAPAGRGAGYVKFVVVIPFAKVVPPPGFNIRFFGKACWIERDRNHYIAVQHLLAIAALERHNRSSTPSLYGVHDPLIDDEQQALAAGTND